MKNIRIFHLHFFLSLFLLLSFTPLSVAQGAIKAVNNEYTASAIIDLIDKHKFELVVGDVFFHIKPNALILDKDGARLNLFSDKLTVGQEIEITYTRDRKISKIVIK